jgi:hypothetical protein
MKGRMSCWRTSRRLAAPRTIASSRAHRPEDVEDLD